MLGAVGIWFVLRAGLFYEISGAVVHGGSLVGCYNYYNLRSIIIFFKVSFPTTSLIKFEMIIVQMKFMNIRI